MHVGVGTFRSKGSVRCAELTPRGPPGQEVAAVRLMKAFAGLNSPVRIAIGGARPSRSKLNQMRLGRVSLSFSRARFSFNVGGHGNPNSL